MEICTRTQSRGHKREEERRDPVEVAVTTPQSINVAKTGQNPLSGAKKLVCEEERLGALSEMQRDWDVQRGFQSVWHYWHRLELGGN